MLPKLRQSKQRSRQWMRRVLLSGLVGGLVGGGVVHAQTLQLPALPTAPQQSLQSPPAGVAIGGMNASEPSRLQVYNVPSQLVGTVGAQIQIQYHNDPRVRVTTDPKSGQLMIMAPEVVHRQVSGQITALMQQNQIPTGDRGRNLGAFNQQEYTLQNLSWREMEDALSKLAGGRLSVTVEPNGEIVNLKIANDNGTQDVLQIDRRLNKITMLGAGQEISGWAHVVYSLDQGQVDRQRATHIVPLAPAEPRKVRQAFQLVKATMQQEQTEAEVEVAEDERATVMGTLDDLGSGSGLFGDVQIEFIEEIDLVIIRGSKDDVRRTLEVIEKIKQQAAETQPHIVVHTLKHANGQAVATLVTQLYETIYLPRQGAVSITALVQPNALLIIGREEVVTTVQGLIDKIDQPLDPEHQLTVRRLNHASAVDIESRVRQFFVEYPGLTDTQRTGTGTQAKVVADYRTNSLIIQAAPRELQEIERLINELDVEGTTAQSEVRVFKLRNTLADDLQAVIEEVITGQGAGGDTALASPPSGRLTIVGKDGLPSAESGILAGVVVTSDPTVNALVVRAPSQSMELIETLIQQLDQAPDAEARIKVFTLENGDATQLAATLQQLYGLQVTAGQGTTGGLFGLGSLQQAALTAGGEGTLVPLNITEDVRTNSIIVSGSPSDLEVVEALLYRLDEEGVETRKTEVIWLRNATASFVAAAVNEYLTRQQQVNQQLLLTNQAISFLDQADREVFIVAEDETNSLILSATPRYFDTIVDVIERLDRRPPLVKIDVLIAEVQLDDGFELGAEWGIQDGLLFDRQTATGGTLSSPVFNLGTPLSPPRVGQDVAAQALSSFALGRSSSAANVGGLVLSASSESVGILIRALQTANRLQILNRPTITTMDARPASTLVGQQVPRVQGVTAAQFGQTVNAVDVPVGLGLAVLPRVNQDGLIVMQVQIQNSSVGDVNTGIPVGFGPNGEVIRSPIINSIEASTTVSAYTGQTVVFAGLISKTRASSRRQIPFLGSLPIIGAAFRFDTETEQRRELLVVMTPRIIQTDEDYETAAQVESSRMSWCLADVLNIHGDTRLSGGNGLWGPAKSPIIFPDLQPTAIDDRAVPRTGYPLYSSPGAGVLEGIPLEYGNDIMQEPVNAPMLDTSSNQNTSSASPFRQASMTTPAR